jgi:hypothetical protein
LFIAQKNFLFFLILLDPIKIRNFTILHKSCFKVKIRENRGSETLALSVCMQTQTRIFLSRRVVVWFSMYRDVDTHITELVPVPEAPSPVAGNRSDTDFPTLPVLQKQGIAEQRRFAPKKGLDLVFVTTLADHSRCRTRRSCHLELCSMVRIIGNNVIFLVHVIFRSSFGAQRALYKKNSLFF